ncbi:MAG: maleylacetoacetate isomerase [Betaproteobacteria bacterium]
MAVTLYGFWRSLAAFRVRAALNYKGVAFEEKIIDLAKGDQFSASYHELNPQHVIPLLDHDGKHITQSLAILEYINQIWPNNPLLPQDPYQQAYVRSISQITIADTHPLVVPRVRNYLGKTFGQDENSQTAWAQHWLNLGSQAIEERLVNEKLFGKFSLGDQITFADLALASHVVGARIFKADLTQAPTLIAIVDRVLAIESIGKAHPLKQPGAPQLS